MRRRDPYSPPPHLPVATTFTCTTTPTVMSKVTTIYHTIIHSMDRTTPQAIIQTLHMELIFHTITRRITTTPMDIRKAPAPAHT